MIKNKKILITACFLMVFAIIGAALVGITNENTRDKIVENERQTLLKKLNTILPASFYDNDLLNDTITLKPDYLLGNTNDSIAYIARKNKKPVAIVLPVTAPNGYNGPINLLVGITHEGVLAGTRVIKHRETPGLGDAIEENKSSWILNFDNKSLENPKNNKWKVKRDGGEFDQFTGATITPRAIVKAIHSSLVYFKKNKSKLFKIQDIKVSPKKPDNPETKKIGN